MKYDKLYFKIESGETIYSHCETIIFTKINEETQEEILITISNPTESQILAAGWQEYIPPQPPEPDIEELKDEKIAEIEEYDASPAVNEFFIGNQSLWLDKDTRTGLNFSLQMEEAAGRTESTLWYDTIHFTLPISVFKNMMIAVELYAKDCYNITAQHKLNVMNLTTKEEVIAYDYTTGYPEKLSFTLN